MMFGIYGVKDAKTGFMSPTVDQNDFSAWRNFEHAVRNSGSVMTSHRQDFDLYRLGHFDSESGKILVEDTPVLVVAGSSLVEV